MVTILDVLQNAEYNIQRPLTAKIGMEQLHNAIRLLLMGYSPYAPMILSESGAKVVDTVRTRERMEKE